MARPATKELGVLGILREAVRVALRRPGLVASVLLLCSVLLTVPKLSPRLAVNVAPLVSRFIYLPMHPSDGKSQGTAADSGTPPAEDTWFKELPIEVAPLELVVTQLSMLAMVYLSAVACEGKRPTLGALLSKVKRSWRKVVDSFLYFELRYLVFPFFFLMLGPLMGIFNTPTSALYLVLLVPFSVFCIAAVFLYLDVPCQLSLVISAVEEEKGGISALGKAFDLARGRRLRGLVLTALCAALHWLTQRKDYAHTGSEGQTEITSLVVAVVWQFAGVLLNLSAQLFGWLLWTVYYYESTKSHPRFIGKDDGVDKGQSSMPKFYSSPLSP